MRRSLRSSWPRYAKTHIRTFRYPFPPPNFRHSFIGLSDSVRRTIHCLDGLKGGRIADSPLWSADGGKRTFVLYRTGTHYLPIPSALSRSISASHSATLRALETSKGDAAAERPLENLLNHAVRSLNHAVRRLPSWKLKGHCPAFESASRP